MAWKNVEIRFIHYDDKFLSSVSYFQRLIQFVDLSVSIWQHGQKACILFISLRFFTELFFGGRVRDKWQESEIYCSPIFAFIPLAVRVQRVLETYTATAIYIL